MRRQVQLLLAAVLISCGITQGGQPDSARKILDSAVNAAASSHRTVFVIFHASWCKWCKRLEAVLDTPGVKELIEENYVVTRLDVQERGDKIQSLENADGEKIMDELGGNGSGLPFFAFIDGKGKKIADSKVVGPDKENIGYPGSDEEIALFEKLLKETAPRMTDEQRSKLMKHFPREGT